MIVRWPGRTEPGSVQPRYVMIEDFYPSIMEMAGLSADSIRPDGKRIDGISFVPLIDGTSDPSAHRPLYWNFPNHWGVEVRASISTQPYASTTTSSSTTTSQAKKSCMT